MRRLNTGHIRGGPFESDKLVNDRIQKGVNPAIDQVHYPGYYYTKTEEKGKTVETSRDTPSIKSESLPKPIKQSEEGLWTLKR